MFIKEGYSSFKRADPSYGELIFSDIHDKLINSNSKSNHFRLEYEFNNVEVFISIAFIENFNLCYIYDFNSYQLSKVIKPNMFIDKNIVLDEIKKIKLRLNKLKKSIENPIKTIDKFFI